MTPTKGLRQKCGRDITGGPTNLGRFWAFGFGENLKPKNQRPNYEDLHRGEDNGAGV